MRILKKAHYGNGRIAIMVCSEIGENLAWFTINIEDIALEIFGPYAMLISKECPEDIIEELVNNGSIKMDGTTFPVGGETYSLAIADKDWFESLENYPRAL